MSEYEIFPTRDEAIAAALRDSAPGDVVGIHEEGCAIVEDPETGEATEPCTCTPLVLVAGAEA